MNLRLPTAFVAVVAGSRPGALALGEAADIDSASSLLVGYLSGRKVLGQITPRGAGHPAEGVEGVAEVVHPLTSRFGLYRQKLGMTNSHSAWETSLG